MKKILLTITAVCAGFTMNAQVLSASEIADFTTWSIYDGDADGNNWGIYDLMTANSGNPVGTPFDSQGAVLMSFSYDNDAGAALTPNNFVISPEFNLAGFTNATLEFKTFALDPSYFAEHYAVYIVSAATPGDISAALATATPIHEETLPSGGSLLTRSVDATSFAGQSNLYLIFRHFNSTDEFVIGLDDILITATAGVEDKVITSSVYPNPANDVLNIVIDEEISSVSIVTLDGKVVSTSTSSQVDVAGLVSGMYIYEVTTSNGNVARNTFMKK